MQTVVIGRSKEVDYPIAHDAVSRRHCRIVFEGDAVWVEDLDSSNGTVLNGTRLAPGERVRVPPDTDVVLSDEVVLDPEFIQSLRLRRQPVRAASSGSSGRGGSIDLPTLGVENLRRRIQQLSGGALVGAAALVAVCLWIGITYYLHRTRVSKARTTMEVLRAENRALFEASQQATSYQELKAYTHTTDSLLSGLDTHVSALRSGASSNLLFGTKSLRQDLRALKKQSRSRLKKANKIVEYVESDHQSSASARSSATSTLESVPSEVDMKDDIGALRSIKTRVEEERGQLNSTAKQINAELQKDPFEGGVEALRSSVYKRMEVKLNSVDDRLSTVEQSLSSTIGYQRRHMDALASMASRLLDRSDGVGAVYRRLQPLSQDLARRVRPVQQSIEQLEKPIVSTGPFGDDVTALSLIKNVDPVTGKTIDTMGEICDAILDMESEINKLARNIGSLREAASSFRSRSTRARARQLRQQATQARQYIQKKRDLFAPLTDKINRGRNYIDQYDRAVSQLSNQTAQEMLREFSRASRSMLNLMERPIRLWKREIDATTGRLTRINQWETRYKKLIENIDTSDYSDVRFGASAR